MTPPTSVCDRRDDCIAGTLPLFNAIHQTSILTPYLPSLVVSSCEQDLDSGIKLRETVALMDFCVEGLGW